MSPKAKQAHRRLAVLIGVFLMVHFATHFAAIAGIAAQDQMLQWGRAIYRIPVIEIALVLALAAQVIIGLKLLGQIKRRKRKGFWHRAQFLSACYLAYFIVMHTVAALTARLGVLTGSGLDTNFFWAAGTLVLDPLRYGFAPYYLLAVIALVTHLIAALHFRGARRWHAFALAIGPLAGALIVAAYGGAFYAIEMPDAHREYFAVFPGVEL
ncbi:MAG: hypothetical protein AAGL10_04790 [Pseudomonadota bacterium]